MNIEENDLPYEEDILRNGYSVKSWIRYIDHKKSAKPKDLFILYERSVKQLPYSYKLWYNYLKSFRFYCKKLNPQHQMLEDANNAHERALITMHKMPRIWIDYLQFIKDQHYVTRFRRTFNRCLLSLPTTQHKRIWKVCLEFIDMHKMNQTETCLRLFRRYMELCADDSEDFIEFLLEIKRFDEACLKLIDILNDDRFCSKYGKSKFELWMSLCDLITKNPFEIHSIKVDPIIRQGISKYKDQVGILWCSLADYYIRSKNFERAKEIYEEAMTCIETVTDFKQIFQAYSNFFHELITKKAELMQDTTNGMDIEVDMEMTRLEDLASRRGLLLNSVMLKQNPYNIENWLERVKLLEDYGEDEQLQTLQKGIDTVGVTHPTVGHVSHLWIKMARIHEDSDRIFQAKMVLEKAAEQPFSKIEDLVDIHCARGEMDVRHKDLNAAMRYLQRVTVRPMTPVGYRNTNAPVQDRVYRSKRLWCFLVDLVRFLGTVEETKNTYNEMIELRIVDPKIILNFGAFMEERNYFEESFRVYQKGVSLFKWPIVYDIWLNYLTKYIAYNQGQHYERSVELFESCLSNCLPEYCRVFYLMYADFVEKYGFTNKALEIYERAAIAEKKDNRLELFLLYAEKVQKLKNTLEKRKVYQLALADNNLTDEDSKKICLEWIELERVVGETDRARELFGFGSQFCDPRTTEKEFWSLWYDFETSLGNSETIEAMQQTKRSVEAQYSTRQNIVMKMVNTEEQETKDSMRELEKSAEGGKIGGFIQFVSGGVTGPKENGDGVDKMNPDAMDIDDDDDSESESDDADKVQIEQKPMPEGLGIQDDV